MLLTFADPAAPGERGQQDFVDMPIERRKLEPLLQISNASSWNPLDQMLQQCGVTAAESPPLSGEPAGEHRAAVDFQTVQKVSVEQPGKRSLPLRGERPNALFDGEGDFDRIDEAIRQVEPDRVAKA